MRTDAERIAKYVSKVTPANVAAIVTAALTPMKTNFGTKTEALVTMELSIQGALNALNVPTTQYPFYLAFGREIWKLTQAGISGDSLTAAAQRIHDKWEAHGLVTGNMIAIAAEVFSLTLT